MAIATPSVLTSRWDSTNSSRLTLGISGKVTLTAGNLYVLGVERLLNPITSFSTSQVFEDTTDVSSTWTFLCETDAYDSATRRMGAYYKQPTTTSTVTLAWDPPGGVGNHNSGALIEIASGFNPFAPIRQSAASIAGAAGLSHSVGFLEAPLTGSMSVALFANGTASSDIVPDATFTELSDDVGVGVTTDSGAYETQYKAQSVQTASASVAATNRVWGGIHLEIAPSLVFTSLGSVGDTTARSAQSCALSRAPLANTLVLTSVLVSDTAGTPAQPTDVSGAGLTFSLVTSSVTFNPLTVGNELFNLSLWRAMGAAPDTSMVTATFANANTGCAILVTEVSGVTTAGVNGAGAVNASATSRGTNASALTLVLASSFPGNGWFSSFGADTSSLPTAVNWVTLDTAVYATPTTGLTSAATGLAGMATSTWTRDTSGENGAIAIEIVTSGTTQTTVIAGVSAAGWAQVFGCRMPRAFTHRIRGDLWVEPGHTVTTNPYTDTSEG